MAPAPETSTPVPMLFFSTARGNGWWPRLNQNHGIPRGSKVQRCGSPWNCDFFDFGLQRLFDVYLSKFLLGFRYLKVAQRRKELSCKWVVRCLRAFYGGLSASKCLTRDPTAAALLLSVFYQMDAAENNLLLVTQACARFMVTLCMFGDLLRSRTDCCCAMLCHELSS